MPPFTLAWGKVFRQSLLGPPKRILPGQSKCHLLAPLKKRGNAALGRNYNSGEAVLELLLTIGTFLK